MHLREFIEFKIVKEEGTVAIIKDQSFHKKYIWLKIEKNILNIMRMANSNKPQMDKLQFMVLMVDDHIRMSMPELINEEYFPPVT